MIVQKDFYYFKKIESISSLYINISSYIHYIGETMKHGLNFDETDSNYMLLNEIFKIIGSRESKQIMSRNGLKPLDKVIPLVKTVILAAYF